jgi:phosphopantothenoylcysteine decarboxylase/phosphopantothenate--cysteine ligase
MLEAVMTYVPHAQIFVSVAAVADWRIAAPSEHKIKKGRVGEQAPSFDLIENPDILATVAALPQPPYCVGFAAETSDLDAHAQAKRTKKGIPLLVGNLAQDAIGADTSELVLYDGSGRTPIGPADKLTLARRLIAEIAQRLAP